MGEKNTSAEKIAKWKLLHHERLRVLRADIHEGSSQANKSSGVYLYLGTIGIFRLVVNPGNTGRK